MFRIAFVVPSLAPLGPVIVVRNLVERMVAHGHECVVFYFDERENAMEFACETRRISFWKRTDFRGFDWVHAHCFRPMVYAARVKGVKKVTTIHSYLFAEYRYSLGHFPLLGKLLAYILGLFSVRVANQFDRVVTLSQYAKNYYCKWIEEEKIMVCCNSVDISSTSKVIGMKDKQLIMDFKQDSILLGCICELAEIKNLKTVIHAMAILPNKYRLLIIGDGHDRDILWHEVKENGLSQRILLIGWKKDAHRYLSLIDVFCLASWSEGFPLVLLEAASYGKAIVCSDIGGMRERFSETEVTYFQPDDIKGLAEAICYAGEHREKGMKAKAIAEERFSTERMYEQYEGVYGL